MVRSCGPTSYVRQSEQISRWVFCLIQLNYYGTDIVPPWKNPVLMSVSVGESLVTQCNRWFMQSLEMVVSHSLDRRNICPIADFYFFGSAGDFIWMALPHWKGCAKIWTTSCRGRWSNQSWWNEESLCKHGQGKVKLNLDNSFSRLISIRFSLDVETLSSRTSRLRRDLVADVVQIRGK